MDIRPVALDDAAEFGRFHEVMDSAERFERPHAGMWSLEEARILFRDGDPAEHVWGVVAVERDEVVAAGMASLPKEDNRHMGWVMPWVEPQRRRQGLGSEVLGHLLERCREEGRTHHIIETSYPFERREDHPYRRFAEKHGFTLANTEVRRHLPLPVDKAALDSVIKEAADHQTATASRPSTAPSPTSWPTPCATPRTSSAWTHPPAPSTSRRSGWTAPCCVSGRRCWPSRDG